MEDLAKIHDMCLEHELDIDLSVDMLEDKRLFAYKSRDKESFREILPVLNAIEHDVKQYQEYIVSVFKD